MSAVPQFLEKLNAADYPDALWPIIKEINIDRERINSMVPIEGPGIRLDRVSDGTEIRLGDVTATGVCNGDGTYTFTLTVN